MAAAAVTAEVAAVAAAVEATAAAVAVAAADSAVAAAVAAEAEVAAVAVAVVADVADKQTIDENKANENKIGIHSFLEKFLDRFCDRARRHLVRRIAVHRASSCCAHRFATGSTRACCRTTCTGRACGSPARTRSASSTGNTSGSGRKPAGTKNL